MSASSSSSRAAGAAAAFGGFLVWGLFPLYWKQLRAIPAWEAVSHRVVWSVLFLIAVLAAQRKLGELAAVFRQTRLVGLNALSSLLLAGNWTIYVWAVNAGHVIESSLGYFLVPLVNVLLGRLFFQERVRPWQAGAILLAALGVGILLVGLGHFPFIALGLAGTWSLYGVLKKRSALGPLVGLTVETLVLFPVAAALLVLWAWQGGGGIGHVDTRTHVFILLAGVVTAVPLLLFAYGAQRIRLTTLGLLQYVTPSAQFLIGYAVYDEAFDQTRWQAYGLIWLALAVYSADSIWSQRARLTGRLGAG